MNNGVIKIALASQILAGCAQNPNLPLLFVQTETLGITVNGSSTQQNAEITLGYRDVDVAIVPVSVTQQTGAITQIKSTADLDQNQRFEDALSVIGQFEANSKAAAPEVALGKFFATGTAAKVLADGFKAKLSLPAGQPAQPLLPVQPHP